MKNRSVGKVGNVIDSPVIHEGSLENYYVIAEVMCRTVLQFSATASS